jgi:hypothetical protein
MKEQELGPGGGATSTSAAGLPTLHFVIGVIIVQTDKTNLESLRTLDLLCNDVAVGHLVVLGYFCRSQFQVFPCCWRTILGTCVEMVRMFRKGSHALRKGCRLHRRLASQIDEAQLSCAGSYCL